jgi:Domain of unknown function (DUF4279)
MKPSGSIIASMVVRGQRLTFSEVDRIFGTTSTSTWKCKPEVAAQVPDLDREEWIFELPPQFGFSFSNALDPLIAKFQPRFDKILPYCQEQDLEISFHLRLNGEDRDFILGFDRPETIKNMAILNAQIFIHTYDLRCLNSYEEES